MSIMEAIYKGRMFPSEQIVSHSEEYKQASHMVDKLRMDAGERLKEDDLALIDEICSWMETSYGILCYESYKFGLSMGMRLMDEAYQCPNLADDTIDGEI